MVIMRGISATPQGKKKMERGNKIKPYDLKVVRLDVAITPGYWSQYPDNYIDYA